MRAWHDDHLFRACQHVALESIGGRAEDTDADVCKAAPDEVYRLRRIGRHDLDTCLRA